MGDGAEERQAMRRAQAAFDYDEERKKNERIKVRAQCFFVWAVRSWVGEGGRRSERASRMDGSWGGSCTDTRTETHEHKNIHSGTFTSTHHVPVTGTKSVGSTRCGQGQVALVWEAEERGCVYVWGVRQEKILDCVEESGQKRGRD